MPPFGNTHVVGPRRDRPAERGRMLMGCKQAICPTMIRPLTVARRPTVPSWGRDPPDHRSLHRSAQEQINPAPDRSSPDGTAGSAIPARGAAWRRMLMAAVILISLVSTRGASAETTIVIENGAEGTFTTGTNPRVVVGNDDIRTEERKLRAYSGIELDIPAELTFAPANAPFLRITGPSNILPLVTSEIKDDELIIAMSEPVSLSAPIQIAAGSSQLHTLSVAGSGAVRAAGLSGTPLRLSLSGSGSITAAGRAETVHIRISGSGEVDASAVAAPWLIADISGAGSIRASAMRGVVANISGSGSILVQGNPPERHVSIAGSGRVQFR